MRKPGTAMSSTLEATAFVSRDPARSAAAGAGAAGHDPLIRDATFQLAPISLWLEDFSGVRALFTRWRAEGVTDLGRWLAEDPERVRACASRIRVLAVNPHTLALFGARDLGHLVDNLQQVFRDEMLQTHVQELVQLWEGQQGFTSQAVNYTLQGQRLDLALRGTILPGHEAGWERVLLCADDVTERESARRAQAVSEAYARGIFEHSPVSLWVEDFSAIKRLIDDVREQGIQDFRVFTDVHEAFVHRCMREIRVIDVNRYTLEMFGAPDRATLLRRLPDIFRDKMRSPFKEQLIDLWHGKLFQQREVVNYALGGEELHLHLQFSVLPGYERDWSLVQVALTDITARKKAEAYLEFLGRHDALTKLCNRAFYDEELNRLERRGPFPVAVIIVDLNGLKQVNDLLGHATGDGLLRRAGEVLGKAATPGCHIARTGGDEFAVLMPGTDERGAEQMLEQIDRLVEVNNQFYPGVALSLSAGWAVARPGDRMEAIAHRADERMYEAKRTHYRARIGRDAPDAG